MSRRTKLGRSGLTNRGTSSALHAAQIPKHAGSLTAQLQVPVDVPDAQVAEARSKIALHWNTVVAGGALLAAFSWSFWPLLVDLVKAWETEADYSHGYVVPPVACYFLWMRRASFPAIEPRFAWGGLLVMLFSASVRLAGSLWYVDAIQTWSIPFWFAGACWFLGGRKLFLWALPSIAFLGFMIPLPFRAEHLLSYPLQRVASQLSCWMLQSLCQPAIREGNVIFINDFQLNVVEACSGLRIFVSVIALTFAYLVVVNRRWWVKCSLILAALPTAVAVNAARIALTGLLHAYISGEAAHKFSHDFAGWLMLPVAAALLAGVAWYADKLFIKLEAASPREVLLSGSRPGSKGKVSTST